MVWSATTLWAETADGNTQSAWNQQLTRSNTSSANSPQPDRGTRVSKRHLKNWNKKHPKDAEASQRRKTEKRTWGQALPPLVEKRSYSAPLEASALPQTRSRTPSPNSKERSGGAKSLTKKRDELVPSPYLTEIPSNPPSEEKTHLENQQETEIHHQGCDDADFDEDHVALSGEEEDEEVLLSHTTPVTTTQQHPPPVGNAHDKDLSDREDNDEEGKTPQERVVPQELKRTNTEISLMRRERIKSHRQNRIDIIRDRNIRNESHTLEVKKRAEERIRAKEDSASLIIARRERRKLGPIDRCETEEDRQELRALGYLEYIQHAFVINIFARNLEREKAIRRLRYLFYPIARRFMHRKKRLVEAAASIWRGKLPHPSVDEIREILPPLLFWPEHAVHKILRKMKPKKLHPGRTLAYEQEPCTATFIVTSGRISIRQNSHGTKGKGKLHQREIGEKKGKACFGEDAILKKYATNHVANFIATETTYVWSLSRRDFQSVAVTVPVAQNTQQAGEAATQLTQEQKEAGAILVDAQVVLPLHPQQFRENKIFNFWPQEEIQKLLTKCTYQHFPRGSYIYNVGDHPDMAYVVWKGTVEVAMATGVNALSKMKERAKRLQAQAAAGASTNALLQSTTSNVGNIGSSGDQNPLGGGGGGGGLGLSAELGLSHSSDPGDEDPHRNLFSSTSGGDLLNSSTNNNNTVDALNQTQSFQHQSSSGGLLAAVSSGNLTKQASQSNMAMRALRKTLQVDDKAFIPSVGRTYINVGQCFGEESGIFRTIREGTAKAATDALVYKIPCDALVDGCLCNPTAFHELIMMMNHQRAMKLQRPPQAVYVGLLQTAIIPSFQKLATAKCFMKGEPLPLSTSIVYLQQGSLTMEGVLYEAPIALGYFETFNAAQETLKLAIAEAQREISSGGGGASAGAGAASGAGSSGGTHAGEGASKGNATTTGGNTNVAPTATSSLLSTRESKSALNAAIENKIATLPRTPVVIPNKSTSRVDAWVVDLVTLLRKVGPKVTKLSDLLLQGAIESSTNNNNNSNSNSNKSNSRRKTVRN